MDIHEFLNILENSNPDAFVKIISNYYDTYEEMEKDINTEKEMQRYMESYDLTRMMEYQLRKNRNHVLELRLILSRIEDLDEQ